MKNQQERLQAVILLDASHTYDFEPLTVNYPKCLIQLANVPLIEYSLEWLFVAGCISEIFIMGHQRSISPLRVYIESQSKWAKFISKSQCAKSTSQSGSLASPSPYQSQNIACPLIHFMICPNSCNSIGDYLRELDAENIILGDFVLLRSGGDIVSNVNLNSVWQEYRSRREINKNAIMTTLCTRKSPGHRSRSLLDNTVYILDEDTRRLLGHELVDTVGLIAPGSKKSPSTDVQFPIELLNGSPSLACRFDLVDGHVDICSMDVLALFTENFDYQDMFQDFVKGILSSDILSHQFYLYILKNDEYLNRASDPYLYDALTKDMLQRWTYPIVPDSNLFNGLKSSDYVLTHDSVYINRANVNISRSAILSGGVMIGSDTSIDHNAIIKDSIIGNGCVIGADVSITGSYIFDGVKIERNVNITRSIVGQACHIKLDTIISRGAVIAPGVIIGPSAIIPPRSKLITLEDFCHVSKRKCRRMPFEEPISSESDEIALEDDESYEHSSKDIEFYGAFEEDHSMYVQESDKDQSRLEIPMIHMRLSDNESDQEDEEDTTDISLFAKYSSECRSLGTDSNAVLWTLHRSHKFHNALEELSSEEDSVSEDGSQSILSKDGHMPSKEQLASELQTIDNDLREIVMKVFTGVDQDAGEEPQEPFRRSSAEYRHRTDSDSYGSWHGSSLAGSINDGTMRHNFISGTIHDGKSKMGEMNARRQRGQEEVQHFLFEISDTLKHALQADPVSPAIVENACIEINALKFACNMGFEEVRMAVIPVLVGDVLQKSQNGRISYSAAVQETFTLWAPMLQRFTIMDSDKLHLLNFLVDTCVSQVSSGPNSANIGSKIFPWIVTELYQNDVIGEEVILRWWKRESEWQYAAPAAKLIRSSVSSFIQWLEEAEDEESQEETEDEDEE